jgi:hypothetical protein
VVRGCVRGGGGGDGDGDGDGDGGGDGDGDGEGLVGIDILCRDVVGDMGTRVGEDVRG